MKPNFKRRDYWHFAFFAFYVFYSFFYYLQTDEFKFNSFVWVNHPDWERIQAVQTFSDDPLQLRAHINQLTLLHFVVYLGFSIREIIKEVKSKKLQFWKLKNQQLRWLRNLCLHFFVVIIIFIVTKTTLGRDLGDHFIASYITLIIYLASIKVVNDSLFFKKSNTAKIPEKYSKSSLNESQKDKILDQLQQVMQTEQYFTNNMASLPHLSKKIGCVSHHVSQVINERLGKSFFEWMAELRVEKAKELLSQNENHNITIEELAERVGYNSKSSFNKAFKKYTSQTPTQFKNSL
ncbi:AraC family transcriptional regulator [Marinifilum sp. D714]|uniref:helix-turn-helix domain-containing protein n=1 Tax=Marinifilum sp. D714 TaxID=2937523 RepID=UPI0027D28945|nr:helix-turn-helix domain-containing protein [Marinifilum sp. D714]